MKFASNLLLVLLIRVIAALPGVRNFPSNLILGVRKYSPFETLVYTQGESKEWLDVLASMERKNRETYTYRIGHKAKHKKIAFGHTYPHHWADHANALKGNQSPSKIDLHPHFRSSRWPDHPSTASNDQPWHALADDTPLHLRSPAYCESVLQGMISVANDANQGWLLWLIRRSSYPGPYKEHPQYPQHRDKSYWNPVGDQFFGTF